MEAPFLGEIDWRRPWLASIRETAASILHMTGWRVALNDAARRSGLLNHRGMPIRFVLQSDLPPGTAYEAYVSASGCVPTRDNLHDFFNALVWLTFPQIKVRLNAIQASEIARREAGASPKVRGGVRDAATIFDENAALLVLRDAEMLDAFRAHRWIEVFMDRRDAFGRECEVWLFGHALMEKLVRPYKAITAHAWPVVVDGAFFSLSEPEKIAWIDEVVSRHLTGNLANSSFTPLPVLGVPGWWGGQDRDFYGDLSVFRPKRAG
jgi:hypothetical protein